MPRESPYRRIAADLRSKITGGHWQAEDQLSRPGKGPHSKRRTVQPADGLTALIVFVCAVGVSAWAWFGTIDIGSLPDWLAGVGAVMALMWARIAARAAAETNRAQQVQLDAIRRGEREKQASAVAAWIEVGADQTARYVIANNSGQPVFNFVIWWNEDTKRCRARMSPVVPPGQWWMFESVAMFEAEQPFGPTEDTQYNVAFSFTDQTQIEWVREITGGLGEWAREPDPLDLIGTLYKYREDEQWMDRPRR